MGKNKYYCKINGTIENLEDIQNLIDKNEFSGKITLTMYEKYGWNIQDAILFEDVIKFNNNEIPADYNECLERMRARNRAEANAIRANSGKPTNSVKCPYCKSTNTTKISNAKKAVAVGLFGIFGMSKASKQWHCNSCKSDF